LNQGLLTLLYLLHLIKNLVYPRYKGKNNSCFLSGRLESRLRHLAEGQVFKEYDLIYLYDGMMFWGARNVDGRGFDKEENRPNNLQIPMVKW
jgi:hypothetical protein